MAKKGCKRVGLNWQGGNAFKEHSLVKQSPSAKKNTLSTQRLQKRISYSSVDNIVSNDQLLAFLEENE